MVGAFLGVQATVRTGIIVGEEAQGVWDLAATFLRALAREGGNRYYVLRRSCAR